MESQVHMSTSFLHGDNSSFSPMIETISRWATPRKEVASMSSGPLLKRSLPLVTAGKVMTTAAQAGC